MQDYEPSRRSLSHAQPCVGLDVDEVENVNLTCETTQNLNIIVVGL
jgi:hypothetical protein